jgi:hypothetical protein
MRLSNCGRLQNAQGLAGWKNGKALMSYSKKLDVVE